jgi:hypothetical protein
VRLFGNPKKKLVNFKVYRSKFEGRFEGVAANLPLIMCNIAGFKAKFEGVAAKSPSKPRIAVGFEGKREG